MTASNLTITGVLESAERFSMFGFVIDAAGTKVFLHVNTLKSSGFAASVVKEFTDETTFVVETEEAEKGPRATRVITIDGKTADELAPAPVQKPKRTLAKRPKKVEPTAPAAPKLITLDMFCNPSKKLDCNKQDGEHKGECLYGIRTATGEFVQYVVVKDDVVIRQLGKVSLAEARENIGKVIQHPELPGAGVKTNDPTVSQAMAAGNSGQKGKAA